MKLSVIIPVYNEQSTIGEVIDRVMGVDLGSMEKEIVVVDDGSTDGSLGVVRQRRRRYGPIIKADSSKVNFGKGAAIRRGLECATGDIVLVQDADLELNPQEYSRLLTPLLDGGAQVVYGSRFRGRNNQIPARTRFANRFLTALTNVLFGCRLTDMETGFKVFQRQVIKELKLRCVGFDFEPEVTAKLLLAGHRIHEVAISYAPRTQRQGKKIGWGDGLDAVYALIRCKLFPD